METTDATQNNPKTPREYAEHYLKMGISFIPLRFRTKEPALERGEINQYKTRLPTLEEISKWFPNGKPMNIGVICGAVSGNLCIIDFDSSAAFAAAGGLEWCKKTLVVKTSRGFHVWVKTKEPTKTRHYKLANDAGGVDIIGEGGYAVAPPSIHESGAEYRGVSIKC